MNRRESIWKAGMTVRKTIGLLLILLTLSAAAPAAAETARDITFSSSISVSANGTRKRMLDRNKLTAMQVDARVDPYMEIATDGEPCAAVYVEFGESILPYTVEAEREGGWEEIAREDDPYAQSYLAFEPCARFRLVFHTGGRSRKLNIRELYLFSEGDPDERIVHLWQPPEEKADLLLLAAHPDDEVLWFGGLLPYYAGEKQMRVQVVFMTYDYSARRLELLDSIWHCGVRHYPEIGPFEDVRSRDVPELYGIWEKKKVESFLTRVLRRYRPEVVVTHAMDGESGHAAHKICARSMISSITLAADSAYTLKEGVETEPWQVKKCYLHKGDGPVTYMDWNRPLARFDGKTGFQVAQEAYRLHKSQPQPKEGQDPEKATYYVAGENDPDSCYIFTLAYSTVGDDETGNDMLEHLQGELSGTDR